MLRNFPKTKNHCGVCALLLVLSSAAYAQVQTQEPAFEMVKVQGGEFLMSRYEINSQKFFRSDLWTFFGCGFRNTLGSNCR